MSEKEKINQNKEMVLLTESASKKIVHWLEQIENKKVKLSRKEFLNWFIEKSPINLSNSDLNSIVEKYYDEEAFLRRLLKEVKQAKRNGLAGNIELVVKQKRTDIDREDVKTIDIDQNEKT